MSRWAAYVPVAKRRARAARQIAKMRRAGRILKPVEIEGRGISQSFWGRSWCKNLEAYSDFSNRLPRGRTYARNGSVLDLQIGEGLIKALVNGSRLYKVRLKIMPLSEIRWASLKSACAGQVDSLVELLQGEFSSGVMEIVSRPSEGLFPTPKEFEFFCSCPDSARLCKHIAAALYGVGARLDLEPEMLFSLRGVDPHEMIDEAMARGVEVLPGRQPHRRLLKLDELSSIFGFEIDFNDEVFSAPSEKEQRRSRAPRSRTTELRDEAQRLLALVIEKPGLRTPQLSDQLNLSLSAARTIIKQLKQRGLICFKGASKNGGYYRIPHSDGVA